MSTASTEKRILAYCLDSIVVTFCLIPIWIQWLGSYLNEGIFAADLQWFFICALLILFYRWLFLYFLGGTLGKLIMGLRVVPSQHPENDLGLMQSLLRVLVDALSIFFGHALRAVALLRFDRTQVADWVAETRVVQATPRKRTPVRRKLLAILIILLSGWSSFHEIYTVVQISSVVDGQLRIGEPDALE